MQYSFGEQFMTTDCRQCFCGSGGNISCDQSKCDSSDNGKLSMAIKSYSWNSIIGYLHAQSIID